MSRKTGGFRTQKASYESLHFSVISCLSPSFPFLCVRCEVLISSELAIPFFHFPVFGLIAHAPDYHSDEKMARIFLFARHVQEKDLKGKACWSLRRRPAVPSWFYVRDIALLAMSRKCSVTALNVFAIASACDRDWLYSKNLPQYDQPFRPSWSRA